MGTEEIAKATQAAKAANGPVRAAIQQAAVEEGRTCTHADVPQLIAFAISRRGDRQPTRIWGRIKKKGDAYAEPEFTVDKDSLAFLESNPSRFEGDKRRTMDKHLSMLRDGNFVTGSAIAELFARMDGENLTPSGVSGLLRISLLVADGAAGFRPVPMSFQSRNGSLAAAQEHVRNGVDWAYFFQGTELVQVVDSSSELLENSTLTAIESSGTKEGFIDESPAAALNEGKLGLASRAALAEQLCKHLSSSTIIPTCVVFEGVPGTGKTYKLQALRKGVDGLPERTKPLLRGNGSGRFAMTMHPATAYEDFVEGLRPGTPPSVTKRLKVIWDPQLGDKHNMNRFAAEESEPLTWPMVYPRSTGVTDKPGNWFHLASTAGSTTANFTVQDGFFVSICIEAAHYPDHEFVVLLDELNRCNIPKVMGELLTTLEKSKRARWREDGKGWDISDAQVVTLPYSKRLFFVPENIIVVGTMNTTDRSVAPMDAALRRRFAFERVWPIGFKPSQSEPNRDQRIAVITEKLKDLSMDLAEPHLTPSIALWCDINVALQGHGDDAMLGHSYLFDLRSDLQRSKGLGAVEIVRYHWNAHILPQLVDVLVSNDLIDVVFKDKDKDKSKTEGYGLLGVGQEGAPLQLRWTLRGRGMMRVPVLSLSETA